MSETILKTVNLDDPALAGNPEFRRAVCRIAQLAAEPEVEAKARVWRASQGQLLSMSATEVRFFGDQAVARVTETGGLRIEVRNARGEVQAIDPEKMPLSLAPLKRQLQSAAVDRIVQLRYEAIQEKAGLPLAQVVETLRLTRDDASTALAAKLAGNLDDLLNQAVTAIRQLLSKAEADLAKAILPGKHTLAGYNLIRKRRVVFHQLAKEAPQLLPLLGRAIVENQISDVGLDAYKQLKEKFRAAGHHDAVWKFLVKMPAETIQQITDEYSLRECMAITGMLAETGVVPPPTLLRQWAFSQRNAYNFLPPAWFRRAAAQHALALPTSRAVTQFATNGYASALNWLLARQVVPDAHQMRAGWAWIDHQVTEWQEEARRSRSRQRNWPSLVPEYADGEYTVVPLTSTAAMTEEGKRMHHCIATYETLCTSGQYRAFSIRDAETGKSVATLVIARASNGEWCLYGLRGPCNKDVNKPLKEIARRLVKQYNAAWHDFMSADPGCVEHADSD